MFDVKKNLHFFQISIMLVLRNLKIRPSAINPMNFHQPIRSASFVKDVYKAIDYTSPFDQQQKDFILQRKAFDITY